MSLLQYGHLISGNSLLFIYVKNVAPRRLSAYPAFRLARDKRQADTPQTVAFRLWGRGAAGSRRAGGGAPNSPASVILSDMYWMKLHNMSLKGL